MTTKSDVQSNHSNIISNGVDLNKCTVNTTSGSTGTPLKVIADPEARYYSIALLQYAFFECGLRLRDKLVSVEVHLKNGKSMLKPPIGVGFLGRICLSWMNTIEENIRLMKKIKPDALYIYPSVLWQLAKEIRKKNVSEINPRLIFSHAEILTPRCIQMVNSTFDTSIHNLYGSAEFNRLAFQCNRHSGLHMITDGAVIEIIQDGENVDYGEPGEIVVTGLYNYAMPLIRYRIGDIGVTTDESCDCGRSWPLIKQIEGRSNDFSILPSGQAISPMNLVSAMDPKYVKGVTQYQIVQEKRDFFLVKVVVNQEFHREQILLIQKRIQLRCHGEEINVDVQVVNEIEKDKTGKFRFVISKVEKKKPFNKW
jgi:phenylacetate-CoA ligase